MMRVEAGIRLMNVKQDSNSVNDKILKCFDSKKLYLIAAKMFRLPVQITKRKYTKKIGIQKLFTPKFKLQLGRESYLVVIFKAKCAIPSYRVFHKTVKTLVLTPGICY